MQTKEKLPGSIETMTIKDQFYNACNANDLDTAKTIFAEHGDTVKPVPVALLEDISKDGHLTMLRFLIEDCSQQHLVQTEKNNRILSNAVKMSHPNIVKYLVEKCQAGKHEASWSIASFEAAKIGDLETLKYLIDVGGIDGRRFALPTAARHGHLDIVKYLLKRYRFGPECLQSLDWPGSLDVVTLIADELAPDCETYKHALDYIEDNNSHIAKADHAEIASFLKEKISQTENSLFYRLMDKMPGKRGMLAYARLNLVLAFVGYFVAETPDFTIMCLVMAILSFISGNTFKERTNKLLVLVTIVVASFLILLISTDLYVFDGWIKELIKG